MKKFFLSIFFVFCLCLISSAQSDSAEHGRFVSYAGVQLNPLLRQIINFNNTTQTTVSPYLLTYSINNRKNGSGIRFGFGINYNQTSTDDGVTKNETNELDYEIRLGYDKMFRIGKRWETGVGVDLLLNNLNSFTTTTVRDFGTETSKVTDINLNYGIGPMGWIRFYITKRILIGTEASMYYTRGNPKETISVTFESPNQPTQFQTSSNSHFSASGSIMLPTALYLIIKF